MAYAYIFLSCMIKCHITRDASMVNLITLSKVALWTITIVASTILLKGKKITSRNRFGFLIIGTIIFGFIYGQLSPLNPNPMSLLNNLLLNLKGVPLPVPIQLSGLMLLLMLVFVVISNKSICGWGCQLGLLQDALYRVPTPKFNVSKKVTAITRILFFTVFTALLFYSGMNILGLMDPFGLFQLSLTTISGLTLLSVTLASIVFYRPWCRFLCPFGLTGLVVEQFSLFRPRINRDKCVNCMQCVETCPTGAMKDFFDKNSFHNDCFACGACIQACKFNALNWLRSTRRNNKLEGHNP